MSCVFVGVVICLQERLLSPQYRDLTLNFESKDDMEFLESFAGVVGVKWPSLAASFSLSEEEIEEIREEENGEKERALLLFVKWATTGECHLWSALPASPGILTAMIYIPLAHICFTFPAPQHFAPKTLPFLKLPSSVPVTLSTSALILFVTSCLSLTS